MRTKRIYTGLFFIAVIALALLYRYQERVWLRPYGPHNWRQCDCAQFAVNYYTESMNFFEPRMSCTIGNDGKAGSEFPLIYYTAAILYHVFGFHDYFIRILNLMFFFTGLFYLFKAVSLFLEDEFYGLVISLMVFTSPVVIGYAINFLSDVPALSLAFIGLYHFLIFRNNNERASLWKSALCFSLAGLLKITALISFAALAGTLVIFFLVDVFKEKKLPPKKDLLSIIGFILFPLLCVLSWTLYITHYNKINHIGYFLTTIKPFWELDEATINQVQSSIELMWRWFFMYRDFTNTMPVVFLLALLLLVRKNLFPAIWVTLLIVISVLYVILFYGQFTVHDYYLVALIPVPIAICSLFLAGLKERKPVVFNSILLKGSVVVVLSIMILHGKRLDIRRSESSNQYSYYEQYDKLIPIADSLGITQKTKIISIGDGSTGISLYFINRRGWTSLFFQKPEANEDDFKQCIDKGARYAIIPDTETDKVSNGVRAQYLQNQVYNSGGIKIYRL